MNDWKTALYRDLLGTNLEGWISTLQAQLLKWETQNVHAESEKWRQQIRQMPKVVDVEYDFKETVSFKNTNSLTSGQADHLTQVLKQFMPWRKGPFSLFNIDIDTEWRSDWKWQRVLPHISALANRRVLDVGCGSGYHLFRMHGESAKQVIGIDPTTLFFYQFHIFKQYVPQLNLHFVPIGIEQMPALEAFDTVFSMGVLYHRKDPIKFLTELKQQLVKNGELVLETLVIDGNDDQLLMPADRYAQMRNVWFIPSVAMLTLWLQRVGFNNIRVVDISQTSVQEQRATPWMINHSLVDFLNPNDRQTTVEGYPAPLRATFICNK